MLLTLALADAHQVHEPGGDEVDGRGRGGGPVHVTDQFCQPKLPLDVRLRLSQNTWNFNTAIFCNCRLGCINLYMYKQK